jgi:hypothetical protein
VKAASLFALALSALLVGLVIGRVGAVNPAFPADHDTLTYDVHGNGDVYYHNGTHASYPIQATMTHTIVNHTGNWYFANMSVSVTQPADLLHLDALHPSYDVWSPMVHYYQNNGDIRRLYLSVNPDDWTDFYSDSFVYDFLFIPQGTTPGETVYWCMSGDSDSWEEIGFPIGLGTPYVIGSTSLSTVGMAFEMNYVYNGTVTTGPTTLGTQVSVEAYWEWSLGFLTKMNFDMSQQLNYKSSVHNATQVDITTTIGLTGYSLADVPIPYITTTTTIPPIPGFPAVAVLIGLLIALVPVVLLRKRRQ